MRIAMVSSAAMQLIDPFLQQRPLLPNSVTAPLGLALEDLPRLLLHGEVPEKVAGLGSGPRQALKERRFRVLWDLLRIDDCWALGLGIGVSVPGLDRVNRWYCCIWLVVAAMRIFQKPAKASSYSDAKRRPSEKAPGRTAKTIDKAFTLAIAGLLCNASCN